MEQIPIIDRLKKLVGECNRMPRQSIEQLYTLNEKGTTSMSEIVDRLKEMIELMVKEQGVSINPGIVMFIIMSSLGNLHDYFLRGGHFAGYFGERSEFDDNTTKISCGKIFSIEIDKYRGLTVTTTLKTGVVIKYLCRRDNPNEIDFSCSEFHNGNGEYYRKIANIWIEFDEDGLWNSCSHHLDSAKRVQGKLEQQTIAYKYKIQDGNITMEEIDAGEVGEETLSPLPEYEPRKADVMNLIYPPIDSETFRLREEIPYLDILGTVFREIYDQAETLHKASQSK